MDRTHHELTFFAVNHKISKKVSKKLIHKTKSIVQKKCSTLIATTYNKSIFYYKLKFNVKRYNFK